MILTQAFICKGVLKKKLQGSVWTWQRLSESVSA